MPPRGRHPHNRLTDAEVRSAGPGRHCDGNGLHLFVRRNGARSWVQRLVIRGERRDLGLGPYPLVSLARARAAAAENRRVARAGGDPTAGVKLTKKGPTLREVYFDVVASRRASWRNPSSERRWRRMFAHVPPKVADKAVSAVTVADVSAMVLPLWDGRGSTGYVLRQHLDAVMRWAIVHKYRPDNPAAQVSELTSKGGREVRHHPSLPHRKVREAMRAVEASSGDVAVKLALLFTVLCAARLGEVSGATWSEMDLEGRVWTRPPERMKARKLHRVPLSEQALEILGRMRALERGDAEVFLLRKRRGGLRRVTSPALRGLLRPFGYVDEESRPIVMHGFRSTFRVWALEMERAPYEVSEAALAHRPDPTVGAYLRSPFEMRAELMQAWADYVVPRPRG